MMRTISGAEEIGNNIDLLSEILVRLPLKPVVRFKCVSKQWLSLISDPQFCISHTRHHHTPYPTPTALLVCEFDPRDDIDDTDDFGFEIFLKKHDRIPESEIIPLRNDTIPKVPFFDDLNPPNIRIRQSCNGLFLCSVSNYSYYICNPTTKKLKRLSFPSCEFENSLVSVCIAFDPLKSNHYKLICICLVKDKTIYQIEMYSSETVSWSPLGTTFTLTNSMEDAVVVFCNGVVHWLIDDEPETLLYFDVDKECLNTMPMPDLAEREVQYFGESQGRLHLIMTEDPCPLQFDVLEMAPDYSGWFVRYHVNLDALRRIATPIMMFNGEIWHVFSVLHVIWAQKEEESIVVLLVNGKAISYNVHDGTLKNFGVTRFRDYKWSDTFQYFEILASV